MMTAVEWLQEALEDTILTHEQIMQTIGLFEQAKEMEKQQLNDAYNADRPNLTCYEENTAFKEYYNETFNNED
jgi:hypothetical protein